MLPARIRLGLALAVVAVLGPGPAALGADPDPAAAGPTPPTVEATWTARILYPVAARATPGGRRVAKLQHYTTWSQGPTILMVTESKSVNGKLWVRVHLPLRPNGRQAWVPEDAVDLQKTTTWIRISTGKRTVQVYKAGKLVKSFKAAVGTGGTPTPKGRFAIYDPVPTGGQLGPYILVLTAHSNVLRTFAGGDGIVGIHGWPSSDVLGKAVSHGCVRMARTGVRALARFAKPGTPVEIVA